MRLLVGWSVSALVLVVSGTAEGQWTLGTATFQCRSGARVVNKKKFCHNCQAKQGDRVAWTFPLLCAGTKVAGRTITVVYECAASIPSENAQKTEITRQAREQLPTEACPAPLASRWALGNSRTECHDSKGRVADYSYCQDCVKNKGKRVVWVFGLTCDGRRVPDEVVRTTYNCPTPVPPKRQQRATAIEQAQAQLPTKACP
jgi:hypothetical protein